MLRARVIPNTFRGMNGVSSGGFKNTFHLLLRTAPLGQRIAFDGNSDGKNMSLVRMEEFYRQRM